MNSNNCDTVPIVSVRKIKPTRRSLSGRYAFRHKSTVPFESSLERDFVIRQEFDLNVSDVVSQPCCISYVAPSGRTYKYTPDFLVTYRLTDHIYPDFPRPLLVEVKPENDWRKNWRIWLPKWKAAYRYAKHNGWDFRIYDEFRIAGGAALKNIRFLEMFRRDSKCYYETEHSMILKTVTAMGSVPIHYLIARHYMGHYRAQGIAHIWYLLASRRLDCNILEPLNEFTHVWVANHG